MNIQLILNIIDFMIQDCVTVRYRYKPGSDVYEAMQIILHNLCVLKDEINKGRC